jgi:hypothetical protein
MRHSDAETLIYDSEFDPLVSILKSKLSCIKKLFIVAKGTDQCLAMKTYGWF